MSKTDDLKPMEIGPEQPGPSGEWLGFTLLFLAVAVVFTLVLLWLTGSILIATATAIGMIALMLGLGWLASGNLDRRR